MSHIEGYDAQEGDLENFLKRIKSIWETERSKSKGALDRYALSIGFRNRRVEFAPTVTTGKGVMTIIGWNLTTDDIEKVKKSANEIGLTFTLCPYLWFELPAVLPNESPSESLPSKSENEKSKSH